ncbi:MAG: NAD(P)H-dependent oxidoreductase [Clostridia bacterium]|nr:NAD(P)H-dependent oxidoreductase [Clostridia bacterium]MBR2664104.1 NAD(P)H-dependent oxidoreductase [Clostridia bacterium]
MQVLFVSLYAGNRKKGNTVNILFVDACVRMNSRTRFLARHILAQLDGTVTEVNPATETKPIVSEQFINRRNKSSETGEFSDPVYTPARQFSEADIIVIAAPYWDLSFPAVLKAYFEQINVLGLTFEYTDDGFTRGLCRAKKLIYVTTAGGPIVSDEYGYGYVKALAQNFYGIPDVCQVKAERLDMIGADVAEILNEALKGFIE